MSQTCRRSLNAISYSWGVLRRRAPAFLTIGFLSSATGASSGEDLARHVPPMTFLGGLGDPRPASTNIPKSDGSQVQMVANYRTPIGYFLDQLPADFDMSKVPSEARDVAIAKVRALESPSSLGGRDQSGTPPTKPLRDVLFIRIRVLEVRSGSAAVGKEYDIYFGERGRDFIYPGTPGQLARDYMVAMYFDSLDGKHRLIGFPISSTQYSEWQAEVSEDRRSQYKK
jgi:hypothetical protein